ncbi:PP2C family protein-serine/threonine phosphatase [Bailinhaonella thermotolerans]|uniref:Serine/threonine-protein phosphatase n=1 Tax=Bailinhaonella thermotolerans TaxID=1070861 RepID=A0A3A4A4X3_9ACTN|nr:protein phosphatase 2C domain-containing protein [Bailinhaonella thermotolerans]RJL20200.1 serine/threonine-protein phosphatase [Bailinhaonella thermotolerans]
MTTFALEAAGASDVGLVRRRNEDAHYAGRWLFAVADGLGGHPAGDIASTTVINTLRNHDRQAEPAALVDVMGRAVFQANEAVRHATERRPELTGMGTTLVAMLWSQTTAVVANVGDSRAYLLRNQEIKQLTEDHTYGRLLAEASAVPNLSSAITRFIDGRAEGRSPDLTIHQLRSGDRILLCSDGLSGVVPHDLITARLASPGPPQARADRLVDDAIEQGGPDNVTVIIVDVLESDVRR